MKHVLSWFVLATFLASFPVDAYAQSKLEQARILFDAGVQAYTSGRYHEAVESFHEAYILSGKPQALFSLAQAERRLHVVSQDGQFLRLAIEHFRKYLELVTEGGRRADAAEALEQLELFAARENKPDEPGQTTAPSVQGKLLVSTTTEGATISIDGASSAVSPVLEVVKPGKHIVRVSAKGYITEERDIVALEDTLVPVEITLREMPAYLSVQTSDGASVSIDGRAHGDAPLPKRVELRRGLHTVTISLAGHYPRRLSIQLEAGENTTARLPLSKTRQRITSYVLLGASGAFVVGAAIPGLLAVHEGLQEQSILAQTQKGNISQAELEEYNASVTAREQFRNLSVIGLVSAGALGLAGGLTYFFDSGRTNADAPANSNTVGFSFMLSPSSAGMSLAGHF